MYQPEKLKARRKELKLTQREIAEATWDQFPGLLSLGTWGQGTVQGEGVPAREYFKSAKGYFTQIEIVRLYHSLSKQGREKVVLYARNLSQEEKAQKSNSDARAPLRVPCL